MLRIPLPLFALAFLLILSPASAKTRILPSSFELDGNESRQAIAVYAVRADRPAAVIPNDKLKLVSNDRSIVEIVDGFAIPRGNGQTTIQSTHPDGSTAECAVSVTNFEQPHVWSFRNDVESILARSGCNMGACHGSLAGKGGFRLSLRGYDPVADYMTMTREARGRRIELGNPATSLVLTKPTGAVPHKGGLRLDTESRDYRIFAEWIASGAKAPGKADPTLDRISVLPENALLEQGESSRILVNAHYSDGRVVDVTHWSQFSATDEAIASVQTDGHVDINGGGESAILVWFGSKVALARLTVPFNNTIDSEVYATAPQRNFIDRLNLDQLKTLHLEPSPDCDDGTFLRRATLDTLGRLPTLDERTSFLAGEESTRRDDLIDRLLASDDFADYWSYQWSDLLVINGTRLRPLAVKSYYDWVHQSVVENKPWDQFVREILTSKGISTENGATNFFALNQSPEEMTENACQAFMGLSIGCAKCHNHPLEKWTNDQYYAMANMFARVRAKGWGGDTRNGDGVRTLYVANTGDLVQPNKGRPQPPAPLDAEPLAFDDPSDRREVLADWMTSPENPYFSRAITNRIWANFFGRGLVEQVDDLRKSNPASNEALLTAAAEHLVDAQFDLKVLMRTILQSKTYQRSSLALPTNKTEQKYLSRYYPRRLMAEVLLDSIDQSLGTHSTFVEIAFPGADKEKTDFYKEGTRAIELYDSAVDSYFLKTFGRNPREITCACERSEEPSMVQVLHLSNGSTLNDKFASDESVILKMLNESKSNDEILEQLYLRALCRMPTSEERQTIRSVIAEYGDDRKTALSDAAWGILTSPEFTFNH
jgi:hypothetical protein